MGDIPYHTIFAISESPLKYGLIYVGTDDGKVWVTKDGGKKWEEIMAGLPYQKWVSRIVASASMNGHRLYDPERQARRRLRPVRVEVDGLRQDLGGHLQGDPARPGQRHPRGPREPEHPLCRDGPGRVCDDGWRKTWTVLGADLPTTMSTT